MRFFSAVVSRQPPPWYAYSTRLCAEWQPAAVSSDKALTCGRQGPLPRHGRTSTRLCERGQRARTPGPDDVTTSGRLPYAKPVLTTAPYFPYTCSPGCSSAAEIRGIGACARPETGLAPHRGLPAPERVYAAETRPWDNWGRVASRGLAQNGETSILKKPRGLA